MASTEESLLTFIIPGDINTDEGQFGQTVKASLTANSVITPNTHFIKLYNKYILDANGNYTLQLPAIQAIIGSFTKTVVQPGWEITIINIDTTNTINIIENTTNTSILVLNANSSTKLIANADGGGGADIWTIVYNISTTGSSQTLQNTYDLSTPATITLDNGVNGPLTILNEAGNPDNILFKVSNNANTVEYLQVKPTQFSALTTTGFTGASTGSAIGLATNINASSNAYIYGNNSTVTNCDDAIIIGNNSNVNDSAGASDGIIIFGNNNIINETTLIGPYNSSIIGFNNVGDNCDNNFILGSNNRSRHPNNIIIGRNIDTSPKNAATTMNFSASDLISFPLVNQTANFFYCTNGFNIFDNSDTRDSTLTAGNMTFFTQSNFISDIATGFTVSIDTLPYRRSGVNNTFLLVSDNLIYRDDQNDSQPEHVRTEGLATWRDDTSTLAIVSTTNTVVHAGSYAQNPAFIILGNNIILTFPNNSPLTGITYRVQSMLKMTIGNAPRI